MEIAEEEEEEQRASKRQSLTDPDGDRPRSPASASLAVDSIALDSRLAASPEHAKFSADSTAELPTFVGLDNRPTSSARSSDAGSIQHRPDLFTSYSATSSKPKVKLGPRPSLEVSGRPHTAASFRPISAIPAGFKLFGKGIKKAKVSKTLTNSAAASVPEAINGQNLNSSATSILEASPRSKGEAAAPLTGCDASMDYSTVPSPPSKKATMTPEKARLMKAMQLREKKKTSLQPPINTPPSAADDLATEHEEFPADGSAEKRQDVQTGNLAMDYPEQDSVHGDSGHVSGTASFTTQDQKSDLTQSDSPPASPVIASSEANQSTKASSLSESTDETILAKDDGSALRDDVSTETQPREVAKGIAVSEDEHVPLKASSSMAETTATKLEQSTSPGASQSLYIPFSASPMFRDQGDMLATSSNIDIPQPAAFDTNAKGTVATADLEAVLNSRTKTKHDEPRLSESTASTDASPTSAFSKDSEATSVISPHDSASTASKKVDETMTSAACGDKAAAVETHEETASEAETVLTQICQPTRKGFIEPIRTDLAQHTRPVSGSEVDLSDDDELMKELQSATVQEARPMIMAKTPVSATFSTGSTKERTTTGPPHIHKVRTVSNPVRGNLITPTDVSQSSARSLSSGAAYIHQVTQQSQQQGVNLANKPNIGSSISQRIKALEKLTAASGDTGASGTRERPSSTFFTVKKLEPSRSSSVLERANSLRKTTPESRPQSKESSSEAGTLGRRERSMSVTDRLSVFEPAPALGANAVNRSMSTLQRGQPESVSVTARIVRDSSQNVQANFELPKDPSEYNRLDLKQSPLVINHQKATTEPAPETAAEPTPEPRSTPEEHSKSSKSRQSSLSIVRDFIKERRKSVASSQGDGPEAPAAAIRSRSLSRSSSRSPPVAQNSAFSPHLSISSCRSSLSQDRPNAASPIGETLGDDGKSAHGDKMSRAGRFMRRLSNLSASRSKNSSPGITHAVAEESAETAPPRPATTGSPTIVSYMGDVNVQFPDTLLWKRRNLSLDSQGFLILSSLPAQSGRPAQGIKCYHLGEFRPPYIPDVEIQELPNSVVLNFIEGTSIQFACEDRAGQANVLSSEFCAPTDLVRRART